MCHDTKFCIVTEAARLLDCVATQGHDMASQAMTQRWAGALGGLLGAQAGAGA